MLCFLLVDGGRGVCAEEVQDQGVVPQHAEASDVLEVLEYRTDPRIVLGGIQHVQRLAKRQVAHDVEGGEVEELDQVEFPAGLLLHALAKPAHELVDVFEEEGLLLLERAVGKRRRKDFADASVVFLGCNEDAGRVVWQFSISSQVFEGLFSWSCSGAMAVDLLGGQWMHNSPK